MTTSVTFETAALQSSISKAESIAPDKGNAFDKAAGIVIEVSPADEAVVLRSTNLDVYYLEWVDSLESSGEHAVWRLPSQALAAFIKSLPIGSGRSVTMTQDHNSILFSSGRTKAKLITMRATDYVLWEPFDEDGMTPVNDLGTRLSQVEWAASRDVVALGVRFDGTYIMATDRYRLAVAPMEIPGVTEGFTIPPATLTSVIKPMGEAKLKQEGSQLLLMPDDHTQIRCVMIGEKYPPVERLMDRVRPNFVKYKKTELIELIRRALSISSDRLPRLRLIIGRQEIAVMVSQAEKGYVGDVLPVPDQADHPRCEINFSPNNILDAIQNSPSEEVVMGYDAANAKLGKVYLNGGSGYEVWVAPLGDAKPEQGDGETR